MIRLNRRQALAMGAAALATPAWAKPSPLSELHLFGPPATPSVVLAHAVATGRLSDVAARSDFTVWRNPDELRAGLTSGSMKIAMAPVQAVANLYNRGFPVRLLNTMTNGLLYILSSDPAVTSIPDLDGRKIAVPFKGDTPDIIFDQLAAKAGITLTKESVGSSLIGMQMLLAGQVDVALVAEPAASAAILRGKKAGKTITRAINLQTAWADLSGNPPIVPQAGIAVMNDFAAAHGDILPALQTALEQTLPDVLADPMAAAQNGTRAMGLPAPVIAQSIPHANLAVRPARAARADIERMLALMGAKLPDDGFYL